MPRISPTNLSAIERTPASPAALTRGVAELLGNSVAAKAKVDAYNWETGEYRVVLQGTLDLEETKFDNP
ncbi:MAG: hypothetical protein ACRENJ_11485 [Candidatus Eiseniibacteriota bacterium]